VGKCIKETWLKKPVLKTAICLMIYSNGDNMNENIKTRKELIQSVTKILNNNARDNSVVPEKDILDKETLFNLHSACDSFIVHETIE
jgi:hypothetical protein